MIEFGMISIEGFEVLATLLALLLALPFAVSYNKFETFVGDLGNGSHDLQAAGDVLKVYASNAVPSTSADSIKADLAEITPQFGYPSAGSDVQNTYTEGTGTGTLDGQDVTWTASGGSFGDLQYIVLFNETQSSPVDPLISWWDYGSAITINDGESFTVDFGASIFTLA